MKLEYLWDPDNDSCVDDVVTNSIKDVILACPSLKSICLECNNIDWGMLTGSILEKTQI